jgi:hypothetical protein
MLHSFRLLAGIVVVAFAGASLLLPAAFIQRLDWPLRGLFDGRFGDGSFLTLHRVMSIVAALFGLAIALNAKW